MDAGGAGHLRDPRNRAFHVGRSGLHQIGQFINDHDNVRHAIRNDQILIAWHADRRRFLERNLPCSESGDFSVLQRLRPNLFGIELLLGFRQGTFVKAGDVADAGLGKDLVA